MPMSLPNIPHDPRAREEDPLKKRKKKGACPVISNNNNNNKTQETTTTYVSRDTVSKRSRFSERESAYVYKYIEKYTCVHNKQYKYTVSLFIYDI